MAQINIPQKYQTLKTQLQNIVLNIIKDKPSDLIDIIYPVGSIYMSVNDVDPSVLFGGTWQRIEDRFLLAKGENFNTLNGTGGATTVSLTQSQMPRHTHTQNSHSHSPSNTNYKFLGATTNIAINGTKRVFPSSTNGSYHFVYTEDSTGGINEYASTNSVTATNKYTGGSGSSESASNGASHENMPPYLIVNMWKRTA